jgi:hypothetical protein
VPTNFVSAGIPNPPTEQRSTIHMDTYYPGMHEDERLYTESAEHAEHMEELNRRTLEMMMMDDAYAEQMNT